MIGAHRKYHWTPVLEEQLRRIYAQKGCHRPALSAEIVAFAKRLGWPTHAVKGKAQCLGLSTDTRRPWTRDEIDFLREHAGSKPSIFLQRQLHRSYASIACKMEEMRLSLRVTAGYSRADLATVMGVALDTVRQWVECGWLHPSPVTDRIPESQVQRFIRAHPEEYSLKRVDEAWLKGMLFPGTFGRFGRAA